MAAVSGAPVAPPPSVSDDVGAGLIAEIEQAQPMPLHGALRCAPGELLALVGPSGAGKSSWLRVLAGLMRPARGRVQVGGEVWLDTASGTWVPPQRRHVGLVFQHYALMPHLSAQDNVALALLEQPRADRAAQALQWLRRVGLDEAHARRRPAALSGGQQQRVALARALARQPRLLLLDEPFSAVDQLQRQSLYALLAELRQQLRIPIVLVTHDLSEAHQLADTLAVMDRGEILQQGAPQRLYRAPRNARVADVVGIQNRFAGRWEGPADAPGTGWLQWLSAPADAGGQGVARLRVPDKGRIPAGQPVTWVIQRDGLTLTREPVAGDAMLPACARLPVQVCDVRHLGDLSLLVLALRDAPAVQVRLTLSGAARQQWSVGDAGLLQLDCAWVHVMPTRLRPV
ncbi:ABC transporter ATP-binding protein [Tepidimonas taiwanensis]|uniref:ABC transporter ATP-binding protein n=1 Tax=Tepidimonas taiwanensis TaxID=307486 RepID=UPI0009E7286A|nr:ABC transporter ATP-binding protein [Tepidimonas taiwanensis]